VLFVAGGVILVVAVAPAILVRVPGLAERVLTRIADVNGTIAVGRIQAGWLRPLVVEDITIRDQAGNNALTMERLSSEKSLISLLLHSSAPGHIQCRHPVVTLVSSGTDTNLEHVFHNWIQGNGNTSDSHVALELEIEDGRIDMENRDTRERYSIDSLVGSVAFSQDSSTTLRAEVHGAVSGASAAGRLDARVVIDRASTDETKGEFVVQGDALPLGLFVPWLRREVTDLQLQGTCGGQLKGSWSQDAATGLATQLEGSIACEQCALTHPCLADQLKLAHAAVRGHLLLSQGRLKADEAVVECDFGKITLRGNMETGDDLLALLSQSAFQASADVDLARLAGALPRTLHLQQGSRVDSGRIHGELHAERTGTETIWKGNVATSDLKGLANGKPVVLQSPLSVAFAIRKSGDEIPTVEQLRCDSSFLCLTVSSQRDSWTAAAQYNLHRLAEELAPLVDFSAIRFSGTGSSQVTVRIDRPPHFVVQAVSQFQQLELAGPGREPWREPALSLQLDASGEVIAGAVAISSGKAQLRGGHYAAEAQISEPIPNLLRGDWGQVQLALHGDVAEWQKRLSPWLSALDAYHLQGSGELTARLRVGLPSVEADQIALLVQDFAFQTPIINLRDPSLRLRGHCRCDAKTGNLDFDNLHLEAQGIVCDAAGKFSRLGNEPHLSVDGQIQYDLAKLAPTYRPYLGADALVVGSGTRPFRLEATGAITTAGTVLSGWTGNASLAWKTASAYGCEVGSGVLDLQVGDGWLRGTALDTTINRGHLRWEPTVRLAPGQPELILGPQLLIDHAQVTPAMSRRFLSHALPILAHAIEVDGQLSVALDTGRVPLTAPYQGDVAGRFILHSVRVGATPLLHELSALVASPSSVTVARESTVPFRMVNGRVYHSGLNLVFPDVTIQTQGSVGLDGSLAIIAELPVPPKWLKSSQSRAMFAKQKIRIPIGGSLEQPKLDEHALREAMARIARDTAGDLIQQQLDKQIERLVRPKK
jgi:hypothetical protein